MPLLCRHRQGHVLALLLVVLFAAVATSRGDPAGGTYCWPEPSTCGHLNIHYPFHFLDGALEAEYGEMRSFCGYPGMGILCDNDNRPILRLNRGDYAVLDINYTSLFVSLADADVRDSSRCPIVSYNLTVPNPFHLATSTVSYLFFFTDCSFAPDMRKPPSIEPITCGGTTTMGDFVLPERDIPPTHWWRACKSVHSAPVFSDAIPADGQDEAWRRGGYAKALRGGFQVSWDRSSGPCGRCEQSGGRCAYNMTKQFFGCSKISDSGSIFSVSPVQNKKKLLLSLLVFAILIC